MKSKAKILLIDHEESIRSEFAAFLKSRGYSALQAENGAKGLSLAQSQSPELILLSVQLPDIDSIDVLREIKIENQFTVVIMTTADAVNETAVKALTLGAENYVVKSLDAESLLIVIEHELRSFNARRQAMIVELLKQRKDTDFFIGRSNRMQKTQELAILIARDPLVAVLIEGESGTGKTRWAQWIHQHSDRRDKPFAEVSCTHLPKELLESELFGYEKGAIAKSGLLDIANKGTIFLDEIGELDHTLQTKLLKVLEHKKFRRPGSFHDRSTDVRWIAAANDLKKMVKEGKFREDLFYRLNVMPLELPPLRECKEDILDLAEFFLGNQNPHITLSDEAKEVLRSYNWPGNIRELKNLLERAVLLSQGSVLEASVFPIQHRMSFDHWESNVSMPPLRELELKYIKYVLSTVDNNYRRAAKILGVNRNTLYNRLKKP